QIKGGEFYLVYLQDCLIEDELADCLGLFKSENKEAFLRVQQNDGRFELDYEAGININKLDKGCLIFNTEKALGYKVSIVDNTNKGQEAQFWKDAFLNLKYRQDDFYHTKNCIDLCKNFIKEAATTDAKLSKPEQIELVSKSLSYFDEQEVFAMDDFEEKVIASPDAIKAFREYKDHYQQEREIDFSEEFTISSQAAKSAKRKLKSVLKLDKNFSIYIHGGDKLVEKGYDENKGMSYYKFYFEEEL
ncbi:MAG: nucleoid-associated protein, partial [Bacteroidota bacterium]